MSYSERTMRDQQAMAGRSTADQTAMQTHTTSGWVVGFAAMAGALMIMAGLFHIFAGLVAILDDNFYSVRSNYTYDTDVNTWGWIHLAMGVVVMLAGFYVFTGALWARLIGIVIAIGSAVVNFFFIPYYPVWSVLIIALDVAIIFALASYNTNAASEV